MSENSIAGRVFRTAAALLFASVLTLTACSETQETSPTPSEPAQVPSSMDVAAEPVIVTDFSQETVTINDVQRIVSLTPSSTSIVIEEGAADRIVGIDSSSKGVVGAADCGDYGAPDVAAVVALQPDVVFCGNAIEQSAVDEMRAAGLPVLNVEAVTYGEVSESFQIIGAVIGENAAAVALCEQLAATENEVYEQKPDTAPSCCYVISLTDDGIWTSGPGSFVNTMIEIAGGTCVTADGPSPWMQLSAEELAEADPECIIYASGIGSYDDVISSPQLSNLSAVDNGMVFEIDESIVSQPGPNLNEGLLALSGIIDEAAEGPVPSEEADATQQALTD